MAAQSLAIAYQLSDDSNSIISTSLPPSPPLAPRSDPLILKTILQGTLHEIQDDPPTPKMMNPKKSASSLFSGSKINTISLASQSAYMFEDLFSNTTNSNSSELDRNKARATGYTPLGPVCTGIESGDEVASSSLLFQKTEFHKLNNSALLPSSPFMSPIASTRVISNGNQSEGDYDGHVHSFEEDDENNDDTDNKWVSRKNSKNTKMHVDELNQQTMEDIQEWFNDFNTLASPFFELVASSSSEWDEEEEERTTTPSPACSDETDFTISNIFDNVATKAEEQIIDLNYSVDTLSNPSS